MMTGQPLELQGVDLDGGAHGGAEVHAANVGALGGSGLGLVDGVHEDLQVLTQLFGAERGLAMGQ